jgi:hypothetical protein
MTGTDDERGWDSDLEDHGAPGFDEDGLVESDPEGDLLPCPCCGAMVYDDSERCPHCGDWIMPLASTARGKSRVWILAAVLAIIALLLWILR